MLGLRMWAVPAGVALLLGLAALRGTAADAPGAAGDASACVVVRADRTGDISPAELDGAAAALGASAPPQHVVVLIHGWDTPLYASRKEYGQIARDIRAEFAARGLEAAVVGVQWRSDAGPRRRWVPLELGHRFVGLFGLPHLIGDPYAGKVPVARATGRLGLRRLLLAVHDRYPEARLHLFAHSMGAEAAVHAVRPRGTPDPRGRAVVFCPERVVEVDLMALAGADLDDNITQSWEARTAATPPSTSPRLWWLTATDQIQGGGRDQVLVLRKLARGRRATGDSGPRLRADQIDYLVRNRSIVFDTTRIPRRHSILDYFSRERVAALAGAAAELQRRGSRSSPLLDTLEQVLSAPDEVPALQSYLQSREPTVALYALWRLEHHCCGNSHHLANRYLLRVGRLAQTHPERLERERAASSCRLVRDGIWPNPRQEALR